MDTRAEEDGVLSQEEKCASQLLANLAGVGLGGRLWSHRSDWSHSAQGETLGLAGGEATIDPVEVSCAHGEFPKVMRSPSPKVFKHGFGGVVKRIQVSDRTFR